MRALASLFLLLVAVGFGALAALPFLARPESAPRAPANAAVEEEAPRLDLPDLVLGDYAALAARPLFSAVRRPPPPEAPGVPVAAPETPDLLLGLYEIAGVIQLGDRTLAMLRDPDGRLIRIRAGERIKSAKGEAEVLEITLESLTFRDAGETVVARVQGAEGSGSE